MAKKLFWDSPLYIQWAISGNLNEVAATLAAGQRGVGLSLLTVRDSTLDPAETVVACGLVAVRIPGSDLLDVADASDELATIPASSNRLVDHHTTEAVVDNMGVRGRLGGCPGSAVVDAEGTGQAILDETQVNTGAATNSVGDRMAGSDGDGQITEVSAGDCRHLQVPVDESDGVVGGNGEGLGARGPSLNVTLGELPGLDGGNVGSIIGDPRWVQLRSLEEDTLRLEPVQIVGLLDGMFYSNQ